MRDKKKSKFNLGVVVGLSGFIAGIFLIFSGQWFIGISGTIASGGLAYYCYKNSENIKN